MNMHESVDLCRYLHVCAHESIFMCVCVCVCNLFPKSVENPIKEMRKIILALSQVAQILY